MKIYSINTKKKSSFISRFFFTPNQFDFEHYNRNRIQFMEFDLKGKSKKKTEKKTVNKLPPYVKL